VVELAVKFVPGDSTEHQLNAALSCLEIERLRVIIARTRSIAPSQLEKTAESNEAPTAPPPTKKRKNMEAMRIWTMFVRI
jgi:hypothetical protein